MNRKFFALVVMLNILGGMFGGISLAIAAPTGAECLEQATIEKCATNKTFLNDCADACAGKCIGLTDADIQATPMLCTSCRVMSGEFNNPTYMQNVNGATYDKCQPLFDEARKTIIDEGLCSAGVGPKGCCLTTVQAAQGDDGAILKEVCFLPNNKKVEYNYADCWCEKDGVSKKADKESSLKACTFACHQETPTMEPSKVRGIGALVRLEAADAASQAELQQVNALCFTQEECSEEAYGGSPDNWVASDECRGGKGKCRAPEPVLTLSSPVLGQTQVRGLRQFIELFFRLLLSVVVLTSAIMFIWGGFKYIFGSAAGSISGAKETMTNAVVGLILSFGAVAMLNLLNPATTRYDQLDVFLINKEQFSRNEYCKDYKGTEQKPIKFAEAGEPAGSKSYDDGKFILDTDKTMCGQNYYPQSFAGKTCKGETCPEKGTACLRCSLGLPECLGTTAGEVCVAMAVGIDVKYAEDVHPRQVAMIPVCNEIENPDLVDDEHVQTQQLGLGDILELETVDKGPTVLFKRKPDPSIYEKMVDDCSSKGGLRGIMLGIRYDDTSGIATQVGDTDDVLVMGKSQCGSSGKQFAGYQNGIGGTDDFKGALWCGVVNDSTPWKSGSDLYWTPEEIKGAFDGSAPAIVCHVFLNKQNAPGDPQKAFDKKKCNIQQTVQG
jgi:hypothetical protein